MSETISFCPSQLRKNFLALLRIEEELFSETFFLSWFLSYEYGKEK
jgi:hypothetical protein